MKDLMVMFKEDVEKQGIKYAASKQIFCPIPTCGAILDYRTTVVMNNGTVIICEKCFIKVITGWLAPENADKLAKIRAAGELIVEYVGENQEIKKLINDLQAKLTE